MDMFCDVCKKSGHTKEHHRVCHWCAKDDFFRHVLCPVNGCGGCAIECSVPQLGDLDPWVKCNKCNTVWEDLDCVMYEYKNTDTAIESILGMGGSVNE